MQTSIFWEGAKIQAKRVADLVGKFGKMALLIASWIDERLGIFGASLPCHKVDWTQLS